MIDTLPQPCIAGYVILQGILYAEVFEAGMVETCIRYLGRGLLKPPLHFQFVLGVIGGMSATAKSLLH
ncbi:MAG: 3-keto-5-aminohexanoate cleavage protein, partial [Nitrososphaeria archaeon]